MLLLHGLFGSGNNLGALARALNDKRTVFSLDLPNHGRSEWIDDAGLPEMADALHAWMQGNDVPTAEFVGHSLGGKVAMQLALMQPQLVSSLVVADIAPVAYPPRHEAVLAALDAVASAGCESRQVAAELMKGYLQEEQVIQFLLTSLRRTADGKYNWRFNLQGLKRSYDRIRAAPKGSAPYDGDVLFIKGGESDYIQADQREQILQLFPRAAMKVMSGCGHWLHAQRPEQFNRLVRRFLIG